MDRDPPAQEYTSDPPPAPSHLKWDMYEHSVSQIRAALRILQLKDVENLGTNVPFSSFFAMNGIFVLEDGRSLEWWWDYDHTVSRVTMSSPTRVPGPEKPKLTKKDDEVAVIVQMTFNLRIRGGKNDV